MATLKRLAMGQVSSTTGYAIYTATTRTVIRTIDRLRDVGDTTAFGVGAADTVNPESTVGTFWNEWTVSGYEYWRGEVVLEPGEQLFVAANSLPGACYVVCGVTDIP